MKPLTVAEITFNVTQCQRQSHYSLDRLDFLSESGKVGIHVFSDKIAKMTLKVGQGYWRRHKIEFKSCIAFY